jgi:hypothetical protein
MLVFTYIEACSARSNVLQTPTSRYFGLLKAWNTRDVLEFTAVQLITPNCGSGRLRKGERGQDFENHLHC